MVLRSLGMTPECAGDGMTRSCEVAIVGSGFAGSLLARVLAVLGYDVVLLERGTHPRFAIGESTTPLANLSLERLASATGWPTATSSRRTDDGWRICRSCGAG